MAEKFDGLLFVHLIIMPRWNSQKSYHPGIMAEKPCRERSEKKKHAETAGKKGKRGGEKNAKSNNAR